MKNLLKKLNNQKLKTILVYILIVIGALSIILIPGQNPLELKANDPYGYLVYNTDMYRYLSDIPFVAEESSVGYGSVVVDKNINTSYNNGLITLNVDGKKTSFLKGVLAHAPSTIVYDLEGYDYDYFQTYYGVDQSTGTNGNGVKFAIYTSVDGETWDLHTPISPEVQNGASDAKFIKIDIRGVKYLKLFAHHLGNKDSDHAVYADAKLIKEGYVEDNTPVNFIKTLGEYDQIIKSHYGEEITGDYELALLQRKFVSNIGYDVLQLFTKYSPENRETVSWLFNNLDNLRLYTLGGAPTGDNYIASLRVLTELYTQFHEDLNNQELTRYNHTYGEIYRKMMITLSLTHSTQVALWMQPGAPENQSTATGRYQIYKDLHKNGKFIVSDRQDHTKWFEDLEIEEMRYVLNNALDDQEVLWLNEYTQKSIDLHPGREEVYLQPHTYIAYVSPNYSNPIFHDPERKEYWDEKFDGIFSKYGVTYSTEGNMVYKVWMNFRNEFGTGAVCGGISKLGSNIRAVHGTPSAVIGQPGHAAIIYYRQIEDGRGYWTLDNDISGWAYSEKSERMPLGWGNDRSYVSYYNIPYIFTSQEAINNFSKYQKSAEILYLLNTYSDNPKKQEEIYRKSISELSYNLDAWWGLIQLYNNDSTKTEKDYYELAKELSDNLLYFPLPMNDLLKKIQPHFTSPEYVFKFTTLQTLQLNIAKNMPDIPDVVQPSLIRGMAAFLLNQNDLSLASFSFDGEDAGKIVLSSKFDGSGVRFDYRIDGENWHEVFFSPDEEHKHLLSDEELNSITAENDIYVHIVGLSYDEENLFKIDILEQDAPTNLYNNDLENRVFGYTDLMEWRFQGSDKWTSFKENAEPNLTGNKTIYVRNQRTGVYLVSGEAELTFTEDSTDEHRKYVPIRHLSVQNVSTEAGEQDHWAKYAIDGNIHTYWHSAWDGSDNDKYITIALDRPIYLTALDYNPGSYSRNGRVLEAKVLVSMTGEDDDWTEVYHGNWANNANTKTIEFGTEIQAKYIKLVGVKTSAINSKSYMVASMINIYEDATKVVRPTASITASETKLTNKDVVLTLKPSTDITIISDDGWEKVAGKNEYTLIVDTNRTVKVLFVDEFNVEGEAIYEVENIDKDAPVAKIIPSTKELTNQSVTLKLQVNEKVELLSSDNWQNTNKNEYELVVSENKEVNVILTDQAGNTATLTYEVTNIDTTKPEVTITSSNTKPTNQEVILTLTSNEAIIINSDDLWVKKPGVNEYILKVNRNQDFTINYQDLAGNKGVISYSVNNIDLEAPVVTISSVQDTLTNKSVVLMISSNEELIIEDNSWKKINDTNMYTKEITTNGLVTVNYQDLAGNKGTCSYEVKLIDRFAPSATITASKVNPSKTVLTLTPNEEIIILGSQNWQKVNDSYILEVTENQEIKVTFKDLAGNYSVVFYKVDWLVKDNQNNNSNNNNNSVINNNNPEENNNTGNIDNSNNSNSNIPSKYFTYKTKGAKLYTETAIDKKLTFTNKELKMNQELIDNFGEMSKYFKLYFQKADKEVASIKKGKMKLIIDLDDSKKFVGIYEIDGSNITKLNYTYESPNTIEVDVNNLGNYLIHYTEKNSSNNNKKPIINNSIEEEIQDNTIINYLYTILIAIMLVVGGIFLINKNRKKLK